MREAFAYFPAGTDSGVPSAIFLFFHLLNLEFL
ncbi:hypothetical protein BASH2_00047 [Bacillus anthracis]|nr:hypothetical protein BASH2_00047 [Bacillus anthracis]